MWRKSSPFGKDLTTEALCPLALAGNPQVLPFLTLAHPGHGAVPEAGVLQGQDVQAAEAL